MPSRDFPDRVGVRAALPFTDGLPLEGIGSIAAIDRIIDRMRMATRTRRRRERSRQRVSDPLASPSDAGYVPASPVIRARDGCLAQRESTSFTPRGSQVQSLHRPPFLSDVPKI